jgi:hypothetical protein
MSEKSTYLQMIQAVISRMAQNSFALKNGTITIVAALLTIAIQSGNDRVLFVAYFPAILLAMLDAYYLWQERLFRALFENARVKTDDPAYFSMDVKSFKLNVKWIRSLFSLSIFGFYLAVIASILITQLIVL